MQNNKLKILVLFVEPTPYICDIIREVYQSTPHIFKYVFCREASAFGGTPLHEGATVCRKGSELRRVFDDFCPYIAVINGYAEAIAAKAIRLCQRRGVPYAVESDTPLNIPKNKPKAAAKRLVLKSRLRHRLCYGFPGGTLQRENLIYYGISAEKNHIMPMTVSSGRLLSALAALPPKDEIKRSLGVPDKTVFLFVGRLIPEKNVPLLISAYARVKRARPDTALVIVGDGHLREALTNEARKSGADDILFCGYAPFPDIMKYYAAADVFVLPSSSEKWGLAVNEAMISGVLPIVSDAVGCAPDLIDDGECGFVFKSGDASSLVGAMERALAPYNADMGACAAKKAEARGILCYRESFIRAINEISAETGLK